jgi:hypothetical protein
MPLWVPHNVFYYFLTLGAFEKAWVGKKCPLVPRRAVLLLDIKKTIIKNTQAQHFETIRDQIFIK